MPDSSLLELAQGIVNQHQRALEDDSSTLVLPVVHDRVELDHDVLEAVATRYGGKYLRCDISAIEEDVQGPINISMAEHLRQLCASRGLPIRISERNGQVVVTADDFAEPTGSLPVVLRVISLLASAEINVPLVVLSYPLAALDEVRRALLWEATLAPKIFANDALKTFVPICGGEVDVTTHCNRTEGSVRFVVREGEYIERRTPRLLSESVRFILDSFDRPLVLFLGAGASASCGLPQGNRVRDSALASLLQRPAGSADLVPAFRRWLAERGRWLNGEEDLKVEGFSRNLTLERVLREEFYTLSGRGRSEAVTVRRLQAVCKEALDRQPVGRQAIWKLSELLPRLVIVTVNFDQLIESGMYLPHDVVVTEEDFAVHRDLVIARLRGEAESIPILKLHGSIENVSTLVADIDTTSRGLSREITNMLDAILGIAKPLTWVWIGCSMRDADILGWLAGQNGLTDLQEWFVDPLPPRSVKSYAAFRRAKEWATLSQSLYDRQITETSDRFLVELLARAEYLRSFPVD